MLDVHPPHAPTHTWRDFFIHIATICVGLLIAIGLEQAVEALHRQQERKELREALTHETEQIIQDTEAAEVDHTLRIQVARQQEAMIVAAAQNHAPLKALPPASDQEYETPDEPFYAAAKASNKLGLFSEHEAVAFGELYDMMDRVNLDSKPWHTAAAVTAAYQRQLTFLHPDPDGSIRGASQPELAQLYGDVAAQEQASLNFRQLCRYIRGAAIALHGGEQDLRKIQASEQQFNRLP